MIEYIVWAFVLSAAGSLSGIAIALASAHKLRDLGLMALHAGRLGAFCVCCAMAWNHGFSPPSFSRTAFVVVVACLVFQFAGLFANAIALAFGMAATRVDK